MDEAGSQVPEEQGHPLKMHDAFNGLLLLEELEREERVDGELLEGFANVQGKLLVRNDDLLFGYECSSGVNPTGQGIDEGFKSV